MITRKEDFIMKENLKVLMLNGSPKANGNTAIALREMENVFKENGIEVENIVIGNQAVRGCIACGSCYEKGKCVFDDVVNEMATKFEAADGLVLICVDGFPLGWAQKRGGQLKNKYNPGWRWQ